MLIEKIFSPGVKPLEIKYLYPSPRQGFRDLETKSTVHLHCRSEYYKKKKMPTFERSL